MIVKNVTLLKTFKNYQNKICLKRSCCNNLRSVVSPQTKRIPTRGSVNNLVKQLHCCRIMNQSLPSFPFPTAMSKKTQTDWLVGHKMIAMGKLVRKLEKALQTKAATCRCFSFWESASTHTFCLTSGVIFIEWEYFIAATLRTTLLISLR